ncbi:MAG: DegT/DnrJ/EryC1/StrS family aminotransferase [Desulfovibrio sp.]|jgi:dTDP-4-amino-4,6-dideoxygalactose transaminase|nr:DegT/DnrJ/EryC1/StrS family aminotransferase [Desulfovibrio sp.]
MDIRINFSGRSIRYTEEEIAVVVEAMRNADPLTQGKHRQAFESAFAAYQGVPQGSCFTTMNGCAALEMSAQLCRFKEGDEVVMPSHTFTASCYPYVKKGARPVWADIDPATRVVTADTVAKVLSPRTRAVVVVHLYGFAADMPAIAELCRKRGILCIEDAAQAIGAELQGVKAGAFGDMGIFSFHSHKNLTTLGEGGMLYVKDPAMAAIVPALRHNGHCPYPFVQEEYWKPAMGNVDMPMLGDDMLQPNNYCLGEVECALGAKLLERIDRINDEKRRRALAFIDALSDMPELEFHREPTTRHNYHLLAARMTTGPAMRDRFMKFMAEEKGIKCVVQYIPLDRYDYYRRLGFGEAQCPAADAFFDAMVSFPFQHWLSDEDFEYMLAATREGIERCRRG